MHNIVETRIEAPRATVWKVLSDFSTYPEWNALTPRVVGECRAGADVRALVHLDGDPFWMPRRIVVADVDARFTWVGRAWYSPLAPGRRTISLADDDADATRVVDDELIGGLGFLMPARTTAALLQRLRDFGAGLKRYAEEAHRRDLRAP